MRIDWGVVWIQTKHVLLDNAGFKLLALLGALTLYAWAHVPGRADARPLPPDRCGQEQRAQP